MVFDLVGLVFSVLAAAAVAYVGRRVLGVPVGWPRSILVSVIRAEIENAGPPLTGRRLPTIMDAVSTGDLSRRAALRAEAVAAVGAAVGR